MHSISISTSPSMQVTVRSSERSDSCAVSGRPRLPSALTHSAIVSASWTTAQPVSVTQVVSITSVPGS